MGFPESELIALFGFFRSAINPPSTGNRQQLAATKQGYGVRPRSSPNQTNADRGTRKYGADWTVAVACLRLLAKQKEPVLSAILGVFEVFALARGDRIRHQRGLEQEKLEKKRQKQMEEERERWKRRRRREMGMGDTLTEVRWDGDAIARSSQGESRRVVN